MSSMVTVISMEPETKGRYRVAFDNGVSCLLYRSELRSLKIREDAQLSSDQYEFLLRDLLGGRAKKRALHLLEQMDRTEEQLRRKLCTGGYPKACVDAAVDYVKAFHYLDDYRYSCSFIRMSQDKMSRRQLEMKLMGKGISKDTIGRAIEAEYAADEASMIRDMLKKRRYDPELADESEKRRTYQYLLRRGFNHSDILSGMRFLT